jgi:hypothetical protein
MKKLFVTGVVFVCGATLRADFTYQQTSQMTGGTLFQMMSALGPLSRQAREPIVATTIVKGNRMARITKDNVNIVDLDKETITEIDSAKKTYSVVTFAQMKQAMEDAMARAQDARNQRGKQSADNPNVETSFKVDAKATGQTKSISGLEAKEVVLTMTMGATNADTAQGGALNIVTDSWMSNVAGYEEVKRFQRKMGEKMGYLFGSGMASLGQMRPETLKGFEEVSKEMAKAEGVPVESTMKMGAQATGTDSNAASSGASQPCPAQTQQQQQRPDVGAAAAGAALSRLGLGGLGRSRNKNNDQQPPQQQQTGSGQCQPQTGSLIEMTTRLSGFSSGPADASKFEVPAGYKQVDGQTLRRAR